MFAELTFPGFLVIVGTLIGFVVVTALVWWFVSRLVSLVLGKFDSMVLLEVMDYSRPISRWLSAIVTLMLLTATVFVVITQMGVDTSGVLAIARSQGALIGGWVGPRMLRIILIIVLSLLAMRIITKLAPKAVRLMVRDRESVAGSVEVEKRANTLEGVVKGALTAFIMVIAVFTILAELGVPIGPMLTGVGIAGIAVGFGAQHIVKDMISGMFILLEDQYRVGDVVRVAGTAGLVEDVNLRRTVLRDLDFIQHFIPNGEITVASNFTKEKSRVHMNIQVAYKENLDHAISVLNAVGEELSVDSYFGPLITDQIKVLRVDSFDESGISIKVLGETYPLKQWEVGGEFRKRVKAAFDNEGIEIPFPHRTLYWGNNVETKIVQLTEKLEEATQKGRQTPLEDAP
jgi:small conductance mechanosensitive channel